MEGHCNRRSWSYSCPDVERPAARGSENHALCCFTQSLAELLISLNNEAGIRGQNSLLWSCRHCPIQAHTTATTRPAFSFYRELRTFRANSSTTSQRHGRMSTPANKRSGAPSPNEASNQAWWLLRRLKEGDSCILPASIKTVQMGLSWDKGTNANVRSGGKDVDCSVALFNERTENVDGVWFRKLKSTCGSIVHSGDNLTGEGDGDDETITISLANLPLHVHYLLFVVTVYTNNTVFSQVENLEVEMRHGDKPVKGDELFTMSLSNLSDEAMLVGQLVRKGPEWSFDAIGEPVRGKDIGQVLKDGSVSEFLSRSRSVAVVVREISIYVLKGRNLAAKDTARFFRPASSDPYYIVKFNGQENTSEFRRQTLNPVWDRKLIELGSVKEGETDLLEISVFDYDLMRSDDFMGVVRVSAGELHALGAGVHNSWFELGTDEQYTNETVSGEILVEISIKEL